MTRNEVLPSTEVCRTAGCPDLVGEENLAGRVRQVCRPAGNRIPGNLSECPTGHLDRAWKSEPGSGGDL